jgi:hypothetical protein
VSTFSELKSNVSNELGLDTAASGAEDVLLGRRLNQGVREVLLRTHCRVTTATTNLTANEDDYELPSDVLAINNVLNADGRALDRVSVEEMHWLRRGDSATGGDVYKYAVDGANLLMIYPTPDTADTLTLYYVPKPTEMSAAGNDPSVTTYGGIPVEFHEAIEMYALWRMASYDDDGSSQMGQVYRAQFDQGIREARKFIRNRGGRKLGPARIGRRTRVPHSPSADISYG